MKKAALETFYPKSKKHWRQWLQKNHAKKQSVWVICYRKDAGVPTISWSDAVDEALCFGWIDSTSRPIDHEKFMRYFCRRKPTSIWSKINKTKVKALVDAGLMMPAGMMSIEVAQQNGSWTLMDTVEELEIPKDLEKEFRSLPGSKKFFESLTRSVKKSMLQWVVLAKKPETRKKRIGELAALASRGLKPKQF